VQRRLIERLGPKSYAIVGSEPSWERDAWAAAADADGAGYLAGRTGARLHGLDSFTGDDIEILVRRSKRNIQTPHRVCSTGLPLGLEDTITINGIRCLKAERLILTRHSSSSRRRRPRTRSTRRFVSSWSASSGSALT